ncbi:hypothetical protein V8C35DRAFT_326667 [Trichoderma chlorosporum]
MVLARDTCREFLQRNVDEHKLWNFFSSEQLDEIAENAETQLEELKAQAEGHFEEEEIEKYAFAMLLLSLYQYIILEDDTGSMHEGTRIATIHATVRGIITIDSKIVEKGIRVHYINENDPPEPVNSPEDFESLWASIEFKGPTKLGTVLKEKVWLPIIEDEPQFTRPCLIYTITDGEPTQEPRETLQNSILECRQQLEERGLSPACIAFGLVQVGEDLKARAFLEELMNIPELENHIDVINENDVLENKFRASQGIPEELAGALYLELLVGAIERVRRLY